MVNTMNLIKLKQEVTIDESSKHFLPVIKNKSHLICQKPQNIKTKNNIHSYKLKNIY